MRTNDEIRGWWIADGAQWVSSVVRRPRYWSAIQQLRNIGYTPTDDDLRAIALHSEDVSVVTPTTANVSVQVTTAGYVALPDSRFLTWYSGVHFLSQSPPVETSRGSITPQAL
jgi:hypothetical protein